MGLALGLLTAGVGAVSKVAAAGQKAGAARTLADFEAQQLERVEAIRAEAREAARATPAEIEALDSVVKQRESAVTQALSETQRFEETVATLDPVIREASEQQLSILRGKAADILKPIQRRRERQKAELEQQLASSIGPGFRTSTAGVQALINFDTATDELMSQTQFNALNQLGQTAAQTAATRGSLTQQLATITSIGTSLTFNELSARGNIRNRELQAILQAPVPDVAAIGRARAAEQQAVAEGFGQVGGFLQQVGGTGVGFALSQARDRDKKEQRTGDILSLPQLPSINLETPQLGSSLSRPKRGIEI